MPKSNNFKLILSQLWLMGNMSNNASRLQLMHKLRYWQVIILRLKPKVLTKIIKSIHSSQPNQPFRIHHCYLHCLKYKGVVYKVTRCSATTLLTNQLLRASIYDHKNVKLGQVKLTIFKLESLKHKH